MSSPVAKPPIDTAVIAQDMKPVGIHESDPITLSKDATNVKITANIGLVNKALPPENEEDLKLDIYGSRDNGVTWQHIFGFGWKPYGAEGIGGEHPDPSASMDLTAWQDQLVRCQLTAGKTIVAGATITA